MQRFAIDILSPMMPSSGGGKETGKAEGEASNATSLAELFSQHARQRQQQQQQQQLMMMMMNSNTDNRMINIPSASQSWQHQQQGRLEGTPTLSYSMASFPSHAAFLHPSILFLRDQLRIDHGNPMVPASVVTNPGLFQAQALARSTGLDNSMRFEVGLRGATAASSSVSANAALNLSAEVSFLRQQQQQRTPVGAAATTDRFATGSVDGGSLYLQERLGAPSVGMAPSDPVSRPSFPSSSLPSSPNPSDLARAIVVSQSAGMSASPGGAASGFGLPGTTNDSSGLSRMILMLRGDLGRNPEDVSASGRSQAAVTSSDPDIACASLPRCNANSSVAKRKSSPKGSFASQKKCKGSVAIKKRSAKPSSKITKPVYRRPTIAKNSASMPFVLYSEDDDDYLTPYQCLLRKQLELFVADPEDVRCSSQQGRTTNIQVGQVGLRCRHCEGGLASRTKGAVYYSHSIDGIYQIGQNIGKVHLAERCYRIPDDIRRNLVALRNDSRRASSGKAYWSDRIRALGVYEEGKILKYRPGTNDAGNVTVEASEGEIDSTFQKKIGNRPHADVESAYSESEHSTEIERISPLEGTTDSASESPEINH
ncbi:hypothetical protein IV203_033814 [Nitzschia inconspicua]|uniref:Uncharacterized protein n=1 Tax=Nitzschia inconspicua TaxID=303405 RepID=A0A9K3Q7B8_9STRA|nr:hypothetical protein IV203_033814 [Nitzschia inconspicua]